ncbi:YagU family protein [Propioniciclava soli]|uniref:YagU family protein n=1 Tax=Propioniciclava soli TaxID=2775081 RepID=UPI001E2F8513|nr:YagU family protein [Propioniciclava soli]
MALQVTDPARRRYATAALVGVIAGAIGAIVKFGWEVPFPPRTPERNATNPPQQLLEQLGVPFDITHLTYTYSGNELPIISFIVHFAFSIGVMVFYAVVAEKWPQIKLWQGAVFGFVVYVAFHIVIMPAFGTVPAPWDQPFEEHFSELFGHVVWLWIMELCRRDLRNRFTHEPDAEVPLSVPDAAR